MSFRPRSREPAERVETAGALRERLGQLWHGEISLAKTYWLYYVLPLLPPGTAMRMIDEQLRYQTNLEPGTLQFYLSVYPVLAVLVGGWAAFMLVPIWRSATRYDGPAMWRWLAKFVVILGVLVLVFSLCGRPKE